MTYLLRSLPHNTRRLEQDIVKALLERLRDHPAEYPPYLLDETRAQHIAQITTIKNSRPALQSGDGGQ